MNVEINGNSKERLQIKVDNNRLETHAVIREIQKTTRKLRRLLKNGFEISVSVSCDDSLLEEK